MSRTVREGLRFISDAWRPHRHFLPLLIALTLVSSAVATAYPLVLKMVIDVLEAAARAGEVPVLAPLLLVLGLIAVGRLLVYVYPAVRAWVNFRIAAGVRARVFGRVLQSNHEFRARFGTGDVLTRLTDDLEEFLKAAWFCCSGIFRAVESSSKVLFAVGVMLFLDARLTLIALLPLPLMVYVFYLVQGRLAAAYERQQKAISATNELLEAGFTGIQTMKAFGTGPGMVGRLQGILDDRAVHQLDVQRYWALFQIVDAVASRAGQVLTLIVGGIFVMRGELTLGTLYAFYVYLDMLVHPLQDLPNLLVSGRQAFASMDRVEEIEEAAGTRGFSPEPVAARAFPGDEELERLELRDVSCAYSKGDEPALRSVSFSIDGGERLAVVGPVGSGKSTLLSLLAGLLQPLEGEVIVNGAPLPFPVPEAYRRIVGWVPQEALLFSAPIRWNVSLGREAESALSDQSMEVAQLGPDLAVLPSGPDTQLGSKGTRISGGQRQRVAMARALARSPRLLLLDDSTASLDAESEDRFFTALDERFPDVTSIVATHRLATVERADRVLLLERGRVVAIGTHEELRASISGYSDLLCLGAIESA